MKAPQAKVSRRTFLAAATAGTAATAAALVGGKVAGDKAKRSEVTDSKKGYQLTEHVRNYYRTAKI
jgi:hypothetical protein